MRLKSFGVRILRSSEGHILLTDTGLKHDKLLRAEYLEKACKNAFVAYDLVKQLRAYLDKHTALKWQAVKKDLIMIGRQDRDFVVQRKKLIRRADMAALQKLDRDVYFWKTKNAPNLLLNKKNN